MKVWNDYFCVILFIAFSSTAVFSQTNLPRDSNGWTIFNPDPETRIIYVSNSGNDSTATYYTSGDDDVGSDPFLPTLQVKPYKTIAAAYGVSRNNKPDWILLKRGDQWYESIQLRNGLSQTAPFLVASYGNGSSRPLLKTGKNGGINVCCKNFSYMAIVDLDFYAQTRDPGSIEYTGAEGENGFSFYTGETYTGKGVLIEGCRFSFYKNNSIQGPGTLNDIQVRRCVIVDNYSDNSHSQGLYTDNVSVLVEQCVFDHNGWYKQQMNGSNTQAEGQATMFNHNIYFSHAHDVTIRENLFLRASSMGTKWTANSGEGSARNITINNNLFVEGEIGISMGGNESAPPYRFKHITVTNNVMLDIGRGQPTNRTLGWCLDVNDWDTGLVSGNLFLNKTNPVVTNVYGLSITGQTRQLQVTGNIFYGLNTPGNVFAFDTCSDKKDITIEHNVFHNSNDKGTLIKSGSDVSNMQFRDNQYYSNRAADQWFLVNGIRTGIEQWGSLSGETGYRNDTVNFPDPDRTIEKYMQQILQSQDYAAFFEKVRCQSKSTWDTTFSAATINRWVRKGFNGESLNAGYHNRKRSIIQKIDTKEYYTVFTLTGKCIGTVPSGKVHARNLPEGVLLYKGYGRASGVIAKTGMVK